MQNNGGSPDPTRRLASLSRRKLIGLVLLVVLALATAHVVYGSGAKKSSPRTHHHHAAPVACVKHPVHGKAGRKKSRVSSCTAASRSRAGTGSGHQHGKTHKKVRKIHHTPLHAYAVRLYAVVDRSRKVFDLAARAAAGSGIGGLGQVCANFSNRVNFLTGQADGVPHAGVWYDPVAGLHRNLIGVYHLMQGAIFECRTAADNGDSDSARIARQDILNTDHQLRRSDDYIHWLLRRP